MEFLSANIWILWIVAIIIFLVIEAATTGLTSIWFAVGALAALIASLFNAEAWLQLVCFLVISIAALCITKPLAKRFNSSHYATNADMIIGMEGIVAERIDNVAGTGAVNVGGKTWTARSTDDDVTFDPEMRVIMERIEGVKLIVKAADAAENMEEK